MRFSILSLAALALGLWSAPAFADSVLFSNLGTGYNVYDSTSGWVVSGSGSGLGYSAVVASLFTVGGSGPQSVTQIDLGVENVSTLTPYASFYASIWTDVAGVPGTQVANAFWNNLSNSASVPSCCSLVTVSGISGVTLNGGQQYFLLVGPVSLFDNSIMSWALNYHYDTDLVLISNNGGAWTGNTNPLGAFDILGDPVPEPASFLLSTTGLAALLALRRRKANRSGDASS